MLLWLKMAAREAQDGHSWRSRWPLGYPEGHPRFPMSTSTSIQTHSLSKVCSSLQPQLHSQVTPICTARPRFQSEGKFPCGINRNAVWNWKGNNRVDCFGWRPISIHSAYIVLFFVPLDHLCRRPKVHVLKSIPSNVKKCTWSPAKRRISCFARGPVWEEARERSTTSPAKRIVLKWCKKCTWSPAKRTVLKWFSVDFLVFNRKGNSPLILTEMLLQVRARTEKCHYV